jgi:hypothetical protein
MATDPARIAALVDKAARDIITEAGAAPAFSKEMRTFHFRTAAPALTPSWRCRTNTAPARTSSRR